MQEDFLLFRLLAEKRKPEIDALMGALAGMLPEATRAEWSAEINRPQRSLRQHARKLAEEATQYPNRTAEAGAERLRSKVMRSKFTAQDMADIEGLMSGTSNRAQLIEEAVSKLKRLGIKIADAPVK